MIKTEKIISLLAIFLWMVACNNMSVSDKLDLTDSLIVKEQYDSAHALLSELAESTMTTEEKAHYYLLSTQLGNLTNHPLPTDSLLDKAIKYYNKEGNNLKLANALYYKSLKFEKNNEIVQAILYGKEAERLAMSTNDARLQFKIAESLAYLNGLCGNDAFQLLYAKKALALAKMENNKNWIACSYNLISFAFENLSQHDSACFYIEKTIPYIEFVYETDKAPLLMNLGLLYKDSDPEKAKELFENALTYTELPEAIEHLADIYYSTGNKGKAYELWKRALTKNSRYDKINLIHSIISYDLERGNIDEVSKNVDEIINIKDSILNKLKNDTIKDLQLRFDHEVEMHEADKKLANMEELLLVAVIAVVAMAFYIYFRKKKTEAKERDYQEQLYAYTTEISQLTANRDHAIAKINELESRTDKDCHMIGELKSDVQNAEQAIDELNKNIKQLLDDKAPKLKQGRMLYDQIMEGGTASQWTSKEEEHFNYYYAAINYQSYNRLRKIERETKLNAHNLFYLILKEMGKDDDEIMRIMKLSREGLRTIRKRTKPVAEDNS